MLKIKKNSLYKVILLGFLIYIGFSFVFLWNYIEGITKIIMLIVFAWIGLLYYLLARYHSSKKGYNKLLTCLILIVILYFSLKFLFTFNHEANHALTVLLHKVNLFEIKFLKFGVGVTVFEEIPSSFIESNIVISGSLGNVIILTLFLLVTIASRKDVKLEIFIPHYVIFGVYLYEEINYWQRSILNGLGDGWQFLELNPGIDNSIALFTINCIIWIVIVLLSLFLFYDLYTRLFKMSRKT